MVSLVVVAFFGVTEGAAIRRISVPSQPVQETTAPVCSLCGDVNGDRTAFNIQDKMIFDSYAKNNGPAPSCMAQADLDGDGVVGSLVDIRMWEDAYAGRITPTCQQTPLTAINCQKCGDLNGDSIVNIVDEMLMDDFVWRGGAAPACLSKADLNQDGIISDTSDALLLKSYLWKAGPEPVC
ncbi:hypothetical protein C4573_02780 [Candidatus Woesearchaeota archaeon]|nr:MAG: hypothetical protein C4573_02780 [Candidatus Woesearchaeota archaeon]